MGPRDRCTLGKDMGSGVFTMGHYGPPLDTINV